MANMSDGNELLRACKIFIESFSTTFQFLPISRPALRSNKGGVSLNTVHLVESKAIPISCLYNNSKSAPELYLPKQIVTSIYISHSRRYIFIVIKT